MKGNGIITANFPLTITYSKILCQGLDKTLATFIL
jgi:hypothetical protein